MAIDDLLDNAYEAPELALGNKREPLDEAIYIILSFQTDLARFQATWSRLKSEFPSWVSLEQASEAKVARVLRVGGLHRQKARTIRRLLGAVRRAAGRLSLDHLRQLNDKEAEGELLRLPGISWKAARCVLLYSLDREVFPVDSNTLRVLKRTGVLPPDAVYRRRALHDALQDAVPSHRRRALHVNLVVHGQRLCTPRRPRCPDCPVRNCCPRKGLNKH